MLTTGMCPLVPVRSTATATSRKSAATIGAARWGCFLTMNWKLQFTLNQHTIHQLTLAERLRVVVHGPFVVRGAIDVMKHRRRKFPAGTRSQVGNVVARTQRARHRQAPISYSKTGSIESMSAGACVGSQAKKRTFMTSGVTSMIEKPFFSSGASDSSTLSVPGTFAPVPR